MKKFLGLLVILTMIASNCLAITFSQPVEIGNFGANMRSGGISIKNASYVSEQPKKIYNSLIYSNGVARFGNGAEALYVHYGNSNNGIYKIGSNDIKNTLDIKLLWASIFKINSKNEQPMYFIRRDDSIPEIHYQYVLIGRGLDGSWKKYFDTEELCRKYMGRSSNVAIQKIELINDMIIAYYARSNYEYDHNFYARKVNERGEFRFKWDNKAQWFGVEQVIY